MARDEQVRKKILKAAVGLVKSSGPAGLRIQEVCEAAGVSAPIVYRHFESREGLVEAAQVERFVGAFRSDAADFAKKAAHCSTQAQLRVVAESAVRNALRKRSSARWTRLNVLGSAYARPELLKQLVLVQDEAMEVIGSALQDAQQRGLIRPELDTALFASWQHDITFSRVFFEKVSGSRNGPQWDELTVNAILGALFGPE